MSENHISLREIHATQRPQEIVGSQTREWLVTPQNCSQLVSHGFGLAGYSSAREEFLFVRPDPGFGQVLACFGGFGEVLIDGRWQICGPGMAYRTPPHVRHAYHAIAGEPWSVAWVHDYSGAISGLRPELVSADAEAYYMVVHGLYTEVMGAREIEVMEQWLRLLTSYTRRIGGASPPGRLTALWEAVTANLAHPWTAAELADRMGLSEEHLRRLSLAETGASPMRYVTQLRMRHAENLLASGRYAISEVALRVGYENPFAFATAFKRFTGRPPSQFRGS